MDLISSNLQATNEKFNSILSGLESTKADALANLETAASTATAAISSQLENVTGDLRSLVPEGFSVPSVNLQGQLQSLSGLTDLTQSANLLASITADFGDALSASGFSLDSLVSGAASAFGSGDSLSGIVPNFERSPLGDVIQKANAVKLPSIDPVVEEASTFTQNTEVTAAKSAASSAVISTSKTLPTEDTGVLRVSEKSKKVTQTQNSVAITKEVTTASQAVETKVTGGGETVVTRKNVSSKGFSHQVQYMQESWGYCIQTIGKRLVWGKETGNAATGINFSSSSFNENISINSVVSTLSSSDNDPLDTHTYALVNGSGDTDNNLFSIDGDQLTINESPNYEEKSSYKIRIQSTDSYGNNYSVAKTLFVNDINDAPTNWSFSSYYFNENIDADSTIAIISAVDEDQSDSHTFSLIDGYQESSGNSNFYIDGNKLKIKTSPDYEIQSSYKVTVRVIDKNGLASGDRWNTLYVNDLDESRPKHSLQRHLVVFQEHEDVFQRTENIQIVLVSVVQNNERLSLPCPHDLLKRLSKLRLSRGNSRYVTNSVLVIHNLALEKHVQTELHAVNVVLLELEPVQRALGGLIGGVIVQRLDH